MPTSLRLDASGLLIRYPRGVQPLKRLLSVVFRFCPLILGLALVLVWSGKTLAVEEEAPPKPFQVGAITVTVLQDRSHSMDISLFSGPATPEERQKFMPDGKAPASVNAFLVQTGGKNILVDSGFGTIIPGAPQLEARLASVGVTPESIDLVLLTHMHSDHIGGLLKYKKRAFPKAQIMVSKPELDFWLDKAKNDGGNANAALVKAVVEAYGQDVLPPFALGTADLLPGISSIDAAGHTPGHSVFLLESEGKSLLILGDLIHAAALQFPLPDECASYDMDAAAAVKMRRAVLSLAAAKDAVVAGMHLPPPAMGKVKAEGDGFGYTPLP